MAIPRLERFCCCCSLRTGSAIIGVLFFLGGLSQVIWNCDLAVKAANASTNSGGVVVRYVSSAVASALIMMSCVLLLHGVRKQHPVLVRQWVRLYVWVAVVDVLMLFVWGAVDFANGLNVAGGVAMGVALLAILIYTYCLIVVRSYYLDLMEYSPPGDALRNNYGTME